jgi:hypothetical protein
VAEDREEIWKDEKNTTTKMKRGTKEDKLHEQGRRKKRFTGIETRLYIS